MPKILPTLAAPAKAAAAGASDRSSSSRVNGRKSPAGRGAFDQALSGARKKEAAPAAEQAEPERRADRTTARPESRKAAKAKDRAERAESREASEVAETDTDTPLDGVDAAKVAAEARPAEGEVDGESSEVDGKKPTAGQRPVRGPEGQVGRDGVLTDVEAGAEENGVQGGGGDGADPALPTIELPTPGKLADLPTDELGENADAEADAEIGSGSPGIVNLPSAAQLATANNVQPEPLAEAADIAPGGEALFGATAGGEAAPGVAQVTATSTQGAHPFVQVGRAAQPRGGPEGIAIPTEAKPSTVGQPAAPDAQSRSTEPAVAVEPLDSAAGDQLSQAAAAAAAPTPASAPPAPSVPPELAAGMVQEVATKPQPQAAAATAALPAVPAEVRFAEDNHASIVAGMRGQLMPDGGTMHIRLDPPHLGPLAVTVRLRGGVMEASFETTSDEAAKLLSHSLGALKSSLESHGMNVERLHVTQAPKDPPAAQQDGGGRDSQQSGQQGRDLQQEQSARQEQQRREMLRRMWRKLSGMGDPLDMVA